MNSRCWFCAALVAQAAYATQLQLRLPDAASLGDVERFHPATEAYLRRLEAEEEALATSPRNMRVSSQPSGMAEGDGHNVLLVVYTDSGFYDKRVKWAKDTWVKQIPAAHVLFIGDKPVAPDFGVKVHPTNCPPHSHWEGACCKYGEAVIEAQKIMKKDSSIAWAYFLDDDAYVRPAELARTLSTLPGPRGGRGRVMGYWGCATPKCGEGLCAGGGYGADRIAIGDMLASKPSAFLRKQMGYCSKCDRWADIAISQIMKNVFVDVHPLTGIYGWEMNESDFKKSLELAETPLLYHYMQSEGQFTFLHSLFVKPAVGLHQVEPTPTGRAAVQKLCSEAGLSSCALNCASFEGNEVCAGQATNFSHPWSSRGHPFCAGSCGVRTDQPVANLWWKLQEKKLKNLKKLKDADSILR